MGVLETSEDAVLGGRLRLRQPLSGHRVGHDAILLAAATDARIDEHAVDFGAGVGSAGLALASRIAGVKVTLVEIDPDLSRLAGENAQLNRLAERVRAVTCDVEDRAALTAAGLAPESVDRVLMNPPFHDARRHNISADPRRRLAHAGGPSVLQRWTAAAAYLLKLRGVLTLIWRADESDRVLATLAPDFGSVTLLPVAPRAGAKAIRVLIRAVKGAASREPIRLPALILNDAQGKPTAAAEAVLRDGQSLTLTEQ